MDLNVTTYTVPDSLPEVFLELRLLFLHKGESMLVNVATCDALLYEAQKLSLESYQKRIDGFLFLVEA